MVKGLRFPDDTNEGAVVSDVNRYLDKVRNLSSTYEELSVVDVKDVQERISAGRNFTPSQMEALNSSLNFISSIRNVVTAFQLYTRTRILAEELSKRPLNEGSKQRLGKVNERLRILYPLMQVLTHKPENEGKLIDDVVLQVRTTLRNSAQERLTNKQREVDFLRGEVDRLANEAEEFRKQLKKGLGIFSNKKPIQRNLESTEEELHQRQGQLELASRELEFAKTYNDLVAQVVDRLDATKPYRKELAQVVARERELNKLLTSVTSTSRFYEKIVELSEEERVRIMEMILQERETELREPGTLRDILNMERFKNILSSHMKVFSTPSYVGFNNDYRTDVIWVTVSLPEGMWDMDLQMRLMNVLSGNINVEASKAVTIKQIPQVDPWTISLTVFFAKGRAENLEKYPSMQRDSQVVRPGDRYLYRSFLLEQGVQDVEALVSQLQGGEGEREAQRQG
ncbi:hypothetical protein HS1genome_1521 [Sulfodiicoccus acidiphilus]|uniref:Uncharacterized protein n=1 Tax=Sulfodiicoccus acidiphilus TaxID=1670455 RepID=A0A348B4N0_9CREN|nr:hypothetical protein HS1genome_1521 [Sulfodiicoccus acidiphilus]